LKDANVDLSALSFPTDASKEVAATAPNVCTPVCTGEPKPDHPDPVATLAAALLGLSPADRTRLAALLLGKQEG
jgi:hypothetical protein